MISSVAKVGKICELDITTGKFYVSLFWGKLEGMAGREWAEAGWRLVRATISGIMDDGLFT